MKILDTTTLASSISSVGFPIFACIYMGYYITKIQLSNNDTINKLASIVENNTNALNDLKTMIEKEKSSV